MSTIKADTVQSTDNASDITLGASGDTVTIAADSINVNKVQDTGGNTLWDFSTGEFVSPQDEFASQNLKLLTTATASGSESIEFTSLIDSTYDVYIFKLIGMQPDTEDAIYFQGSKDGGENYNLTMTTTWFNALNTEADSGSLAQRRDMDQSDGTAMQGLIGNTSANSDFSCSGEMYLFSAGSTTYIKNWWCRLNSYGNTTQQQDVYVGGYFRNWEPVNAIKFTYGSGTMNIGTIKMYGLL